MTLLSTGLETANYNMPGWEKIYNKNVELLNDTLLKVNALLDVDVSTLQDGQVLTWDAGQSKWVPRTYEMV